MLSCCSPASLPAVVEHFASDRSSWNNSEDYFPGFTNLRVIMVIQLMVERDVGGKSAKGISFSVYV